MKNTKNNVCKSYQSSYHRISKTYLLRSSGKATDLDQCTEWQLFENSKPETPIIRRKSIQAFFYPATKSFWEWLYTEITSVWLTTMHRAVFLWIPAFYRGGQQCAERAFSSITSNCLVVWFLAVQHSIGGHVIYTSIGGGLISRFMAG